MLILSTVEENKVAVKVGGTISLDGLSASFDFVSFQKEAELVDGKGSFTVSADEAASLKTPRVFAKVEYKKGGEVVRTELVDTIRVPRTVSARDRMVYSTIAIINAPLDDAEAANLNNASDSGNASDGGADGETADGSQGNLDNGAGEITDADAGQSDTPADDSGDAPADGSANTPADNSGDGETGQNGESEEQNGDNAANG